MESLHCTPAKKKKKRKERKKEKEKQGKWRGELIVIKHLLVLAEVWKLWCSKQNV
jgi:hypothetical protein